MVVWTVKVLTDVIQQSYGGILNTSLGPVRELQGIQSVFSSADLQVSVGVYGEVCQSGQRDTDCCVSR